MTVDHKTLANQLRCPAGTDALNVAQRMNKANYGVNQTCIRALGIQCGDTVLEIGPGNGAFASDVIEQNESVQYVGIDWSQDMVVAANAFYATSGASKRIQFIHGSSDSIPMHDNTFDKVFSVHTLYFWRDPLAHLNEICRVLKPGGRLSLAFGERRFMQSLEFTSYGFALYEPAELRALIEQVGMTFESLAEHCEQGESNTGEAVEKHVYVLTALV